MSFKEAKTGESCITSHIFSILCRDKKFHKDLFEFLNKREVKESLGCYKMQKFDKNDIRYFIQCKGILHFPNSLLKVLNHI